MNGNRTRDELLLAEYCEIGNCYPHDDMLAFNIGSFLLPVALRAVAVAAGQPKLRLVLGLGSLLVCAYWLAVVARVSWYTSLRLNRAAQIEEVPGIDHHCATRRQPGSGNPLPGDAWAKTRGPERLILWLGYKLPARRVHFMLLLGLVVAWCLGLFIPADEKSYAPSASTRTTIIYGGVNSN